LLNIDTLKKSNIKKFNQGITKLRTYLGKLNLTQQKKFLIHRVPNSTKT
jgi:hypothetical protein